MRKGQLKSKMFSSFLALILVLPFCACGKAKPDAAKDSTKPEAGNSESAVEGNGSGEDLFLSLADLPWRDNSLDAYSAVINVPLRYTDEQEPSNMYILGNSRASVYKHHFSEEAADSWEEIKAVSDQGVETSFRFASGEGEISTINRLGGVAGSDHYMILAGMEADANGGLLYHIYELDQDMQVVNSFYADCLDKNDYELPQSGQFQADAQGNLHMLTQRSSDSTYHYYIVAPDGKLLLEASPKGGFTIDQIRKLFPLYDGRIGIQLEKQLQCVNLETGETEVLANIKPDYRGCTLLDEQTLLYADGTGLYRSGLSGENPEILYTWSNHGVSASEIKAIQVLEDGSISLIYMDSRGANYLKLTPTTEEVEIREITFGAGPHASQKYQAVVAAFNKKYPAYRVQIENYGYGDTSLLTQLIAGKGPVLVDTFLADFEKNAEWWEPLDEVFLQMKLEDELIPKVLDAGRINGTLYGVATDFSLDTVITFADEPDEWDYDTFLGCFDEDDPAIKSVYTPMTGTDGYTFISNFIYHGLEEKYLFDAESCTTYFDSDKFRKILRLGRYFMEKEHQGTSEGLRQGTTLCAAINISVPDEMAYLRIWGGDQLRFIGYPSGEGSRHYIHGDDFITVRVNATAEEKRLAHSFLQFLLSYEAQMEAVADGASALSVRRDVLEEQIKRMGKSGSVYPVPGGFPDLSAWDPWAKTDLGLYDEEQRIVMWGPVDAELDGAALYELLEKAEPKRNAPRELSNIFFGELEAYLLEGSLTEERLIEHLENRIELYLSEQK